RDGSVPEGQQPKLAVAAHGRVHSESARRRRGALQRATASAGEAGGAAVLIGTSVLTDATALTRAEAQSSKNSRSRLDVKPGRFFRGRTFSHDSRRLYRRGGGAEGRGSYRRHLSAFGIHRHHLRGAILHAAGTGAFLLGHAQHRGGGGTGGT